MSDSQNNRTPVLILALVLVSLVSLTIYITAQDIIKGSSGARKFIQATETFSPTNHEFATKAGVNLPQESVSTNSNSKTPSTTSELPNIELPLKQTHENIIQLASAAYVLDSIRADLSAAKLFCNVTNPSNNPPIMIAGSVANDTIASCGSGSLLNDGYQIFVSTDSNFVKTHNTPNGVAIYQDYQSPIQGKAERTNFIPSKMAIVFILGSNTVLQVTEVAWESLYTLGYEPPFRR